jgi:hypothetical protein
MDNAEATVAIAGMLTGLLTIGMVIWGVVQYARVRQRALPDPALSGEVAQLRDQVNDLQHQLMEAQERIDFTERLLTQGRDPREAH